MLQLICITLRAIFQPRLTPDIAQVERITPSDISQLTYANLFWYQPGHKMTGKESAMTGKFLKIIAFSLLAVGGVCGINQTMQASNAIIVGSVRVQMLSSSLVRLESAGAEGFEDRNTFHVVNRN